MVSGTANADGRTVELFGNTTHVSVELFAEGIAGKEGFTVFSRENGVDVDLRQRLRHIPFPFRILTQPLLGLVIPAICPQRSRWQPWAIDLSPLGITLFHPNFIPLRGSVIRPGLWYTTPVLRHHRINPIEGCVIALFTLGFGRPRH